VRDEAHRFAVAHHRERRSKAMTSSALDNIPGLGEVRRKALLRHFGSLRRLREATIDEVLEVEGIGPRTAELVIAALHQADDLTRTVATEVGTRSGERLTQGGR
jgi:excinuclease ABC subunit C